MLDSLVRVSRRADEKPSASILRAQFPNGSRRAPCEFLSRPGGIRPGNNPDPCPARQTHADQRPAHAAQPPVQPCAWTHPRRHPSLPSQQFQVLFNSLFKVLFIFPSRYLFAIGLSSVFSLRWDLPPALGCIPKQPDSTTTARGVPNVVPDGVLTLSDALVPGDLGTTRHRAHVYRLQFAFRRKEIFTLGFSRFARRY